MHDIRVPNQIHHRRRMVLATLYQVLEGDVRAYVLFVLWDRHYRDKPFFNAAPLIQLGQEHGLLTPEEQHLLRRTFLQLMPLSYEQLPQYADHLVPTIMTKGAAISASPRQKVPEGEDA